MEAGGRWPHQPPPASGPGSPAGSPRAGCRCYAGCWARPQPCRLRSVPPGGTGYASARSRDPLLCKEPAADGLAFHRPVRLRMGDRSPAGRALLHDRLDLLGPRLAWSDPSDGNDP